MLEWCESGKEVKPEPKKVEIKQVSEPEQNLPEISDERFAKACEVIKD